MIISDREAAVNRIAKSLEDAGHHRLVSGGQLLDIIAPSQLIGEMGLSDYEARIEFEIYESGAARIEFEERRCDEQFFDDPDLLGKWTFREPLIYLDLSKVADLALDLAPLLRVSCRSL